VGTATCGRSAGAGEVLATLRQELDRRGLRGQLMEVGCLGLCHAEPIVSIAKPGRPMVCYGDVTCQRAVELVEAYVAHDDALPAYALGTVGEGRLPGIADLFQTPFFKPQIRRTLRNCGFIDPADIDHYLAHDGYRGLVRALELGREGIIDELRRSGLRGRGGAGFPTWRKWQFCQQAPGDEKYLVCNADEGDPGAFMNRSLLEGDPHSVLEGMLIGGFALGAASGYVYCRAEYPLALERLRLALAQAQQYGLLGENILGSGLSFHIKIKEGAGAFVCGEETALIGSIEGRRGMPRPRPPFPALSGLWGKPTIINNVETLACVALILQHGADWFAQYGTQQSKGTKTFALVGRVKRPGLVEVPLGITLREMIFQIGGGLAEDRPFKAVQTGGPSGGCIPAALLDIPVDYDSLKAAGSIMGSGGMVVMDDTTCMVDFARYFLDFVQKESCGECPPCRLGTKQMLDILEDITEGRGRPDDLDLLLELAQGVGQGSLCGLGQTAPNPVLTTLRYFRDEYVAHVEHKRCPAVACKEIISSPCQHVCPIETQAPVYIGLLAEGRMQEAFAAIVRDNPLPSVCARVCHHPCESSCQAGRWGRPIAVRALKRAAVDYGIKAGLYPAPEQARPEGPRVAVVGSGPAGLMAAYCLAKKDYRVTVFEALGLPGGALAVAIPEYRLPRDKLDLDIENIRRAGVEIRTNTRVGRDVAFRQLLADYQAVFVASGAHKSRRLGLANEDAAGVLDAMQFLKQVSLHEPLQLGRRVGVVGGGNSAVDAARVAARLDRTAAVRILYRRTRAEMPAFAEEIEALIEEGIPLDFLTAPKRILADGGKLTGLECVRMALGPPDASGRPRPMPVPGSEFVLPLDSLIVAVGEEPEADFLDEVAEAGLTPGGAVVVSEQTLATRQQGVFAGGDAVTGPKTVLDAMGAGKLAAEMIDKYLRGQPLRREPVLTRPSVYVLPVELAEEELEALERPEAVSLPVAERIQCFAEVEQGLSEELAVREARRCLRCDLETRDGRQAVERQRGEGERPVQAESTGATVGLSNRVSGTAGQASSGTQPVKPRSTDQEAQS
jgi:NADH-quinone oxidoreductase subunit F